MGNYYVPVSTYEAAPAIAPSRSDVPKYGAGPYGQPPSSGRDSRDPRYGGQPDYSDNRDSRYAYPSPAATVTSVSGRDREPVTSPAPSAYGSMPSSSYDHTVGLCKILQASRTGVCHLPGNPPTTG